MYKYIIIKLLYLGRLQRSVFTSGRFHSRGSVSEYVNTPSATEKNYNRVTTEDRGSVTSHNSIFGVTENMFKITLPM